MAIPGRGLTALGVVAIALMASASSAAATTRYASPTGATTGDCTSPNPADPTNPPCAIGRAVEQQAVPTDEVIIAPGDYFLGMASLSIAKAIRVHGQDGAPLPTIHSSSGSLGVGVNSPGAVLRRIAIDYTGPLEGLDEGDAATVEQVVVHSSGDSACLVEYNALLRDSVCADTDVGGQGVTLSSIVGSGSSAELRNVTAVATGTGSYGIEVSTGNSSDQQDAVAKNVIADGVAADIHAVAVSGGSSTLALSNSNYATTALGGGGGTETITTAGTGTNQTATPLFTDAGLGLFHQAAGSPTIDAGAAVDLLGTLDFDGDARTLGAAPDIGADEFVPTPIYAPPATTSPPVSSFNLSAAIRRCRKKYRKGTRARKRCIKKARARAGL